MDAALVRSRTERVREIVVRQIEINREKAALDAENATLEAELRHLTGEGPLPDRAPLDSPILKAHEARRKHADGSLEERVIAFVAAHPEHPWRAKAIADALGERADSVASTLVRAANGRRVGWVGRGLYCPLGAEKKLQKAGG